MRTRRILPCLALSFLCAIIGCETPDEKGDSTDTKEHDTLYKNDSANLLDDFEEINEWFLDSDSDYARLGLSTYQASEGRRSLAVEYELGARKKIQLRREVDLNLTDAEALQLDVYNPNEPMKLTIGFKTEPEYRLYESAAITVPKGWAKRITLGLKDKKFKSFYDGGGYDKYLGNMKSVSRISFTFSDIKEPKGVFYIDNVGFDKEIATLAGGFPPTIKSIEANATALRKYEKFELTVTFDATYQSFFDKNDIRLSAKFFSPDGKNVTVDGFLYSFPNIELDEDEEREPTGDEVWKIRFTPTLTGRWVYEVRVKNKRGEAISRRRYFTCVPNASQDEKGFIRVSEEDPFYFEFDNHELYYPIGQNVCWSNNYPHFLEKIKEYGGNLVRIWMCPWNFRLEGPTEVGVYDLDAAKSLDSVVELAEQLGVRIQLVLNIHGELNDYWAKNPYYEKNKGPCRVPQDFFTNGTAKALYKRKAEYVVSRWAYSTSIFAWELWNEVDLTTGANKENIERWHSEMSNHLKAIDPYDHLVTTSIYLPQWNDDILELPNIDFTQSHFYDRDVAKFVQDQYIAKRRFRKPYFVGEFGANWMPAGDRKDPRGVHLHAGLWLAYMTPSAGNAMLWWWDTFVDPNNLYYHWDALCKFAKGEERRGKDYRLITGVIDAEEGEEEKGNIRVQGIMNEREILFWVYDNERIQNPDIDAGPLLEESATARFSGMLDGEYSVEFWDTYSGEVTEEMEVDCEDGQIEIPLRESDKDFAVKVKKIKYSPPDFSIIRPETGDDDGDDD